MLFAKVKKEKIKIKQQVSKLLTWHNNLMHIIIFFIISLMPFYWLRKGVPVAFGDSVSSMYFQMNYLNIRSWAWDCLISTGRESYGFSALPTSVFYFFIQKIPFINDAARQALLLFLILLISFIFAYFFVMELFKEYKEYNKRKQIAFFSSLFYVLNFFTLFYFFFKFQYSLYIIPFTSLFLFLLVKGLKNSNLLYTFLIAISISIFAIVFLNPPWGLTILLLGFIYLIYIGIVNGFSNILKFFALMFLICLLINMFWFLPFLNSFRNYYELSITLSSIYDNFYSSTNVISLYHLLILSPHQKAFLWKYPNWRNYYSTSVFVLIGILFPLIIFSSLLEKKKNRIILFFSLIIILGLFLTKAGNPPFGNILFWIVNNIPFMGAYRVPVEKFMIILIVGETVLFGYSIALIYDFLKKYKKLGKSLFILFCTFILFVVYAFPFWTGQILTSPNNWNGKEISAFTRIPEYYFDLKGYINNDATNYRVISLPLRPKDHTTFEWKYGHVGANFVRIFLSRPTFSMKIFEKTWDKGMLTLSEGMNNEKSINKIMGILNIKYAILHHDIDLLHGNYGGITLDNPEKLKKILVKNNFSYIKSFGKLDFYKISEEYFLPHIYPFTIDVLIYNNINDILNMLEMSTTNKLPLFIKKANLKMEVPKLNTSQASPTITFRRINPTRYDVKVDNATSPFFLVFLESYHPKWKAYIKTEISKLETRNGKWEIIAKYPAMHVKEAKHEMKFTPKDISYLFKKPIPEKYHMLVNGYSNAWYIDPKEIGNQNFTITLYFKPQSLFYIGLFLSTFSTIAILCYLLYSYLKYKKLRRL